MLRGRRSRLLNDLDGRNWLIRDGQQYGLSDPGRFVAEEVTTLLDRMETERAVRDVWQWFPTDLPGFSLRLFADAVVSFPDPDAPYNPSPRFFELLEAADTVRAFSVRNLEPGTYEAFLRKAVEGADTELVFPGDAVGNMLKVVPEGVTRGAAESGHLDVFERESFPMEAGFGIFGHRVAVFGRDSEGVARAGLVTDTTDAVAWGEATYEEVRRDASPVDLSERLA